MTITEIQNNRLATLIRTCRMILRMTRNRPGASKSEMLYYQMLDKYFSRVFNAKAEGTKVAAHTVFFPVEILYSMGIAPIHNEVCTWTAALLLGDQAEYLAAGAELGLAPEICSPHRGLAGAYARGDLARPDVVLWSNMICDNTAKSGELIMELNKCPGFFLDHPFKEEPRPDLHADHSCPGAAPASSWRRDADTPASRSRCAS